MMVTTYLDALMDWARDHHYSVYWGQKDGGWVATIVNLRDGGSVYFTTPRATLEEAAEAMLTFVTKED